MAAGPVDSDGLVEWTVIPSTLQPEDVDALEEAFGIRLPPLFRAYLLARFHLFNQVRSRRHAQVLFMSDVPACGPLEPLRKLLTSWRPLLDAGFVPFAEWGDGWGPMCFDTSHPLTDGDCPIVWMDHEQLLELGPDRCAQHESLLPLTRPLYPSFREFFDDVFAKG